MFNQTQVMMKIVSKNFNLNGQVDVLCEKAKILGLGKTKIHYRATKELPKGFWDWSMKASEKQIEGLTVFKLDNFCNDDPKFDFIEDYILYQSFECVLGKEVDTCIFKKLRSYSDINERNDYLKTLSIDQKLDIYNHHKNCIKERTQFKR